MALFFVILKQMMKEGDEDSGVSSISGPIIQFLNMWDVFQVHLLLLVIVLGSLIAN